MYKTGALLRPQHFSEFHKCWTNGVRKPRAADGAQGSLGSSQSQATERWLTGDKTHDSPSPVEAARAASRVRAGATGGGGYGKGRGPHTVLSALTRALTVGGGPGELRSSRWETLPLRAQEPGDRAHKGKCPKWGYGGGCSQGTGFRVPAPEWVARVLRGPGLGSSQRHSPSPGPGKPLAQRGGAQAPRCRCASFLTPTGRQWGQRPPTPTPPGGEAEGLCSGVGRAEGCQHLASGSEGPRAHLRLQQGPREQ